MVHRFESAGRLAGSRKTLPATFEKLATKIEKKAGQNDLLDVIYQTLVLKLHHDFSEDLSMYMYDRSFESEGKYQICTFLSGLQNIF